jgi:hypothetical protein
MKKVLIAALGAMALCTSTDASAGGFTVGDPMLRGQHDIGQDGYGFEMKQIRMTDVEIKLVTFTDKDAFRAEYRKRVSAGPIPRAFSVLNPSNRKLCTIYTIDPETDYRPELYGHELMHCFFGDWHPTTGRK